MLVPALHRAGKPYSLTPGAEIGLMDKISGVELFGLL